MPAPVRPVPRPLPRPPAKKISLPEYKLQLPRHGWLPPIKYVQIQTHSRCNADCVFCPYSESAHHADPGTMSEELWQHVLLNLAPFRDGINQGKVCFAGETLVMTPEGDMPIRALVGIATLLVPDMRTRSTGTWQDVRVRSHGQSKVLTVRLRRGRAEKTIRATPDHRWIVRVKHQRVGTRIEYRDASQPTATALLKPGDRLAGCSKHNVALVATVSAFGVAQGFTFGDGHCQGDGKPAMAPMFGDKDKALLPYFKIARIRTVRMNGQGVPTACDLPRYWKEPPPLDESASFLLGWLAGYFAADGHVSKNGKQATLYSADPANLNVAKAICYRLGVQTSPVRVKQRVAVGCVKGATEKAFHQLNIAVRDLPEAFWIQKHHLARVKTQARDAAGRRNDCWTVVSVEDNNETEEVFCASVPGVEQFTLADNLRTGNCPYLMQEPLIDKTIFAKINDIYALFPRTCVEISTNGAALTDKTIDNLFTAFQGKRHDLWVSHHGINAETLQEIMKIDYDKATANLISLLKKSDGKFNIKIRGAGESSCVSKVYFTHQQYVAYWAEMFTKHNINTKNVSVDSFRFHDRAGTLHRADRGANTLNKGKIRDIGPGHQPFWCGRIDEWVHIDYKGDLVLCCMDYHREVKLPNLKDIWLVEYFHSDAYRELVEKVSGRCETPEGFICERCTSPGG